MLFLLPWLLWALSFVASAMPVAIDQGWQYRWGDSPMDARGVPEWVSAPNDDAWQPIAFPSNPPDRSGRKNAWFRVTLPQGSWSSPVLYIFSVDIIVQVWFKGEKIYQYGVFDARGEGDFQGWPWHAIPLPDGYHTEPMYFRVYSDYTDIGLWGEVAIMDASELTLKVLGSSLQNLITSALSGLIGVLALMFALVRWERRGFVAMSLFALASSVMLLAESQAALLIAYQPLLWDYLAAGAYYLIPVAMAQLLKSWLSGSFTRLLNVIWAVHLGYLVLALGMALVGWVDLSLTFPVFDGLFLISLGLIVYVSVHRFRELERAQQVLLAANGLFSVLLVLDMAVAHGFLPWFMVPVSWGALLFLLATISLSVWHYAATHRRLEQLNHSLEQEVQERTESARAMARRERTRSRLLMVENRKKRKLADVVSEIQDCAGLNQALAVVTRAVPELCLPMPHAFYLRAEGDRYERTGNSRDDGFPEQLGGEVSVPPPTSLAVSEEPIGDKRDMLCFWLDVQSAGNGRVTEGILLVQPPRMQAELPEFGMVRFITSIRQALEKIAITLSNIALREELKRFSYEDSLSGLKNRRYFDELLAHEGALARRTGSPLSLLLVDIDYFKRFNDSNGHEAGDQALRTVARELKAQFRESDTVCRYGGEEFVVLMPGASLDEAVARAEALCEAVRATSIAHRGISLGHLTVSVGVASWPVTTSRFERLLEDADAALYQAKETGRNQVVAAEVVEA